MQPQTQSGRKLSNHQYEYAGQPAVQSPAMAGRLRRTLRCQCLDTCIAGCGVSHGTPSNRYMTRQSSLLTRTACSPGKRRSSGAIWWPLAKCRRCRSVLCMVRTASRRSLQTWSRLADAAVASSPHAAIMMLSRSCGMHVRVAWWRLPARLAIAAGRTR